MGIVVMRFGHIVPALCMEIIFLHCGTAPSARWWAGDGYEGSAASHRACLVHRFWGFGRERYIYIARKGGRKLNRKEKEGTHMSGVLICHQQAACRTLGGHRSSVKREMFW